uniref:venom protease-like n=1 Tax=Styela clava TaxID=7725 RepID=UPI001939BB7E|nr:venom protease-like [Styela clava]
MVRGASKWICGESGEWKKIDDTVIRSNPDEAYLPRCRPRCGERLVKDPATEPLISGGKLVAKIGGWPWMVFIDFKDDRRKNHFPNLFYSKVERLEQVQHDPIDVWLGLQDRYNDNFNFTQKLQAVPNKRSLAAEYGFSSTHDGDIAVLKLNKPAKLSYYVHPICIPRSPSEKQPQQQYYRDYKNAIVIGWGKTESENYSQHLLKTRVGIKNHDVCVQRYRDVGIITENMICAGFDHSANDACKGDAGGPLMTKSPRNIWYLSGVVSFGDSNACGYAGLSGVYTDVGKYSEFIESQMED